MKTCVLCFRRRNALQCRMRSRSRWYSVRSGEGGSGRSRPRLVLLRAAYGESRSSRASSRARTVSRRSRASRSSRAATSAAGWLTALCSRKSARLSTAQRNETTAMGRAFTVKGRERRGRRKHLAPDAARIVGVGIRYEAVREVRDARGEKREALREVVALGDARRGAGDRLRSASARCTSKCANADANGLADQPAGRSARDIYSNYICNRINLFITGVLRIFVRRWLGASRIVNTSDDARIHHDWYVLRVRICLLFTDRLLYWNFYGWNWKLSLRNDLCTNITRHDRRGRHIHRHHQQRCARDGQRAVSRHGRQPDLLPRPRPVRYVAMLGQLHL